MQTAEWICTKCGVTNRKLVDDTVTETDDRCVTCHTRHQVTRDVRPVFWRAAAA